VGNESINAAPISQGRHHGVEPCHEDEDEDEDARPPSRRKPRSIFSESRCHDFLRSCA
jgi:hypothetical protein